MRKQSSASCLIGLLVILLTVSAALGQRVTYITADKISREHCGKNVGVNFMTDTLSIEGFYCEVLHENNFDSLDMALSSDKIMCSRFDSVSQEDVVVLTSDRMRLKEIKEENLIFQITDYERKIKTSFAINRNKLEGITCSPALPLKAVILGGAAVLAAAGLLIFLIN